MTTLPPHPAARPTTPPWGAGADHRSWPPTDPGAPPLGPPPPPPGSTPPPRSRGWGRAAALGAVALLSVGSFVAGQSLRSDDPSAAAPTPASPVATTPAPPAGDGTEPVAAVADALRPAVVQVETGSGLGSGFVYDAEEGLVMTAAHVLGDASEVRLRLEDGRTVEGTVLGADPGSDIGVVRADAQDLVAAPLALDDPPEVGQMAVAIGSPFGLDQTVTAGVVSAVGRTVETPAGAVPMVQTDAPINPGSSGGALADRQGRVIGVNASIASRSGGNVGVGFAVPIETAVSVADRLVAGETITNGYLGVGAADPTGGATEGARVVEVEEGGPGAAAGLAPGDLITALDGDAIASPADLIAAVRSREPGTTVVLTVDRQGDQVELEATLGRARPG